MILSEEIWQPINKEGFKEPPLIDLSKEEDPLKVLQANMSLIGLMTIEFNKKVDAKLDLLDLAFDQLSYEDPIDLSYKFVMI